MAIQISQLRQPLGWFISLSALVLGITGIQAGQLETLKANARSLDPAVLKRETQIKLSSLEMWKKIPAFGFKNLIADLAYIDYLQYFGDQEAREINGYGIGLDYFGVIINKDPKFYYSYYSLSAVGTVYTGQPEKSIALMNQGFTHFTPESPQNYYYLWRLKGVDELLFLNKPTAAQQSMQTAADWARRKGDEEGDRVAKISQRTADFLAKNPRSEEARFAGWSLVLSTAIDLNAKKIAVRKLRELGGKVYLDENGRVKIDKPAPSQQNPQK
jgi:hypothetical protein